VNRPHHVHAIDHPAERGKALAVGVPHASDIEGRLVADADEETVGRRVRAGSPHRDSSIDVPESRLAGPLERDRGEGVRCRVGIAAALNDRDPDGVVGLVLRVHRAEEGAAVVVSTVDVAEEVGRGHGGAADVNLQFEGAHFGFDDDPDRIVGWCGDRDTAGSQRQGEQEGGNRPAGGGENGRAERCPQVISPHLVPVLCRSDRRAQA